MIPTDDVAVPAEPRLPVGYYLDNFELALKTVLQRDRKLFDKDEIHRLALFGEALVLERRLIVRLFTRRPGWHRTAALTYEEIPDTPDLCRSLTAQGLLEIYDGSEAGRPDIAACLRVGECRILLQEAGIRPEGRVGDLQRDVAASIDGGRLASIDDFVRITDRELYHRVMMLFFANRRQDLSDFVIRDIGNQRYETVKLSPKRLFSRREDAVLCLTWADWRNEVFNAHEAGDAEAVSTAGDKALDLLQTHPFDRCSDRGLALLTRPLAMLVQAAATGLEREGEYESAAAVCEGLLDCPIPDDMRNQALLRLLIDLEKAGFPSRARQMADESLTTTSDPNLRYDLMKRRARLARRTGAYAPPAPRLMSPREIHFKAVRLPTDRGARNRFVGDGDTHEYVEHIALQRYGAAGITGAHVENALPGALAAVCFWDIIFMAQPGAFLHGFQAGPLDWGGGGFYRRRETAIQARLEEIRQEDHRTRALENLSQKEGIANPLFSWSGISADVVARTIEAWPGASLALCLEVFMTDANGWGRGFPDLVLFDAANGLLVSEVKGPGDKVSVAQTLWFDLLLRHDVRVELCCIDEAVP